MGRRAIARAFVGCLACAVTGGVGACGSRTPLPIGDGAADGGNVPAACASTPDPARPLTLSTETLQVFGNVAATSCAFAGTWIENRAGHLVIVAATVQASGGAWTASPVVALSDATSDPGNAIVAADGNAFIVAWTDGGFMLLRHLAADGTPVGAAIRSLALGPHAYLQWLEPTGDGELRVGWIDDSRDQFHYLPYFARIGTNGATRLLPKLLTPGETDVDVVGFARGPGRNELAWVRRGPDTMQAEVSAFDDDVAVIEAPKPLLGAGSIQTSRHGLAIDGDAAYFGVWTDTRGTVVGRGLSDQFQAVQVSGGDRPALAFTRQGDLGVLAATDALSPSSDLVLTIVRPGGKTPTGTIARGEGAAYNYAIAGGDVAVGVLWASSLAGTQMRFTVVTPPRL